MSSYYRGDYYRGDGNYGRGDGILSGIGRAIGSVARAVGSVLPGPVGAVASAAGRVLAPPRAATVTTNLPVLRPIGAPVPLNEFGAGAFPVQPGMFGGGGGPGGQGLPVLGSSAGMSMCTTKGFHLNKNGYYRRTPGGGVAYIEARSACVRNRRMNPTNGAALKRALRRAYAFKKVAMKTIRLVDAGRKPKKFGGFKTRKRSS